MAARRTEPIAHGFHPQITTLDRRRILAAQRAAGNAVITEWLSRRAAPTIQRDSDSLDPDATPFDVPQLAGEGKEHVTIVHGRRLKLHGTATATYSHNWHVDNQVVTRATGCKACKPGQCVHATGTLVSDYTVTTSVTLPSVPEGLKECEQAKAQEFIDGPLTDHEQDHVTAFADYNGSTSVPIDLTRCGVEGITAAAAAKHDAEEKKRRAATDAASRKLDPWTKVADLTCDE